MGVIADIKTLLTSLETNIYLGDRPPIPDNLICLYEAGGFPPINVFDNTYFEQPTFQVLVRDTSYSNGVSRCEAIKEVLHMTANTTINSRFYTSINLEGDINALGRDDHDRAEFTLNFVAQIQKTKT